MCRGRSSEDRMLIRALLSLDIKICHRGRVHTPISALPQSGANGEGLPSACGCTWDQLRVQEYKASHLFTACKSTLPFQILSLSILGGQDVGLPLCYLNLLELLVRDA